MAMKSGVSCILLAACCYGMMVAAVQCICFTSMEGASLRYAPNWSEKGIQRMKFKFRTTHAEVFLLSHRLFSGATALESFGLYVYLRRGELFVLHHFMKYEDVLSIGRDLNQDHWHTVTIYKDPQRARLHLQLNDQLVSCSLEGYRLGEALEFIRKRSLRSLVNFGGDYETLPSNVVNELFVGCIMDVLFSTGNGPLTSLDPSQAIELFTREVTLHETGAFLVFTDKFHKRYLRRDITLSFRTYTGEALLLYVHDSFNNFLQIHFEQGSLLILTLNQGVRIIRKVIRIKPRIDDGKWKQLHLVQKREWMEIKLDKVSRVFHVHRLRLYNFQMRPFLDTESITPPRISYPREPSISISLGGVSSNYTSSLPSLHGCLRGVKIGAHILRFGSEKIKTGVISGCVGGCDDKPCGNGGICLEHWNEVYNCNCSYTTYRGSRCTDEIGGSFDAKEVLMYTLQDGGNEANTPITRFSFGFSTNTLMFEDQVLLYISGNNQSLHEYVCVVLKQGRRIALYIYFGDKLHVLEQAGNFDDGYRHKVLFVRNGNNVIFEVDWSFVVKEFDDLRTDFNVIYIGGLIDSEDWPGSVSILKNFTGCISNLEILTLGGTELNPFDDTFRFTGNHVVTTWGNVVRATCSSYSRWQISINSTNAPNQRETHLFPHWDTKDVDTMLSGDANSSSTIHKINTVAPTTIATVACLLFTTVVVALLAASFLWKYNFDKTTSRTNHVTEERIVSNSDLEDTDRYLLRSQNSPSSRTHSATIHASRYTLFPNRYGTRVGLRYCTLPLPSNSRENGYVVSRPSTLGRGEIQRPRNGNYSSCGSTNSVLSKKSRLASMEDLSAEDHPCEVLQQTVTCRDA